MSQLRTRVENAISSMLPHGRVIQGDVARSLGMSERTLARKLSDEGLKFTEILQQLRRDLVVRYLDDRKLHDIENCVAARLSGCERIHACVQALDRKNAEPGADSRRLLSNVMAESHALPQRLRTETGLANQLASCANARKPSSL
jgi:hypothetical protein